MSEYKQSTIELLCVPFLDTDTEKLVVEADSILGDRGYRPWLIRLLRKIVGVGLWTQSIVWEEWHLGWFDVIFGYALLFIPLGIMFIVIGNMFDPTLLSIGILLIMVGFSAIVGLFVYSWIMSKLDRNAKPQLVCQSDRLTVASFWLYFTMKFVTAINYVSGGELQKRYAERV